MSQFSASRFATSAEAEAAQAQAAGAGPVRRSPGVSQASGFCPVCHQQFVSPAQAARAVSQFAASQCVGFVRLSVRGQRVRLVLCCASHAAQFSSLLSEQAFFPEQSPVALWAIAFGFIRQRGRVVVLSGFRCAC